MSTITTIAGGDVPSASRSVINTNFSNLNTDKVETSVIDTDTTLAANSDAKIPSQKAVKAYIDNVGNANASTTERGVVEEATQAEVDANTATGGTGARLFVNPSTLAFCGVRVKQTGTTGIDTTPIALAFAGEDFDTDGFHDNATNNTRLTIPSGKAGKYLIGGAMKTTASCYVTIRLNGSTLISGGGGNAALGSISRAATSTIYTLAVGDYVEFLGTAGSGINTSGDAETNFWLYKI